MVYVNWLLFLNLFVLCYGFLEVKGIQLLNDF